MKIADMFPGYEYAPGSSILEVVLLPVFGERGDEGFAYLVPVWLPPEYREPTPQNIALTLAYVKLTDPEAAKMIAEMENRAFEFHSQALAAEKFGAASQGKAGAH